MFPLPWGEGKVRGMWQRLPKPFLALAPMDDITDVCFRQVVAEEGRPDVFFTEFVNVEALCSPGRNIHGRRLEYTEDQRPIIVQLWGKEPEHFRRVASELVERGFDGIDINMGCPDRTVLKNGLCGALIEDHARAAEIIAAVREGTKIPLSVKTRLGVKKLVTEEWIGFLLEQNLDAITIHARTVKEMSKAPARWEEIRRAVNLRDAMKKDTVIIGNGDVMSRAQALDYAQRYGCDGVMIGRGVFQNLWIFHPEKCDGEMPFQERLRLLRRHVTLWEETWGGERPFAVFKKFLKIYIAGFDGAAKLRAELMACESPREIHAFIDDRYAKRAQTPFPGVP